MKLLRIVITVIAFVATTVAEAQKEILYVGTFSVRGSKGIYVYEFNRTKNSLKLIQTISDLESPNFLEIHPSGKFLYAVNQLGLDSTDASGSVTAYTIDQKTGKLSFVNHVSSYGRDPCHILIDKTGEWAFISNYGEGNFVVLPLMKDGAVGAAMDAKKYAGSSINSNRQEKPHIHNAAITKDNKFVYVADLGTDKIYNYKFDSKAGKLNGNENETNVIAGAGPRHLTIHPSGKYGYVSEELTSSVAVLGINNTTGALSVLQDSVPSLPENFKGINTSADIKTDPQGNYLYLSNRGHDALAIYSIDNATGEIKFIGHQNTKGKTPRNFLFDRQGKYIFVANQNSDNIVLFKVNTKTGLPVYSGKQINVPSPVCLKLLLLKP